MRDISGMEKKKKKHKYKNREKKSFVQGTWDSAYYIILKSSNWPLYVWPYTLITVSSTVLCTCQSQLLFAD